ncbi:hypothetical protein K438DRAFT_1514815, partial [Mycena galopus ATCC 62051]
LHDKSNQQQYQNSYVATPKEPAYKPYQLSSTSHKRQRAFAVADRESIAPINPLLSEEWDIVARQAGLIPPDGHVRPLQIECLNIIVSGGGDICAIGPTGCGISLLWVLPLHAMGGGISLVVTPYMSLGCEGETNNHGHGISSIFIYSEQNSAADFELAANGHMMVIYACIEMIEGPSFARILHSEGWHSHLSAIYVDEAHLVHESHSWCPAYSRLHQLRALVGDDKPLVPIS